MLDTKTIVSQSYRSSPKYTEIKAGLLKYARELEKELRGKTYHINQENMDQVLVNDYLTNTRKVLNSQHKW